MTRPVHYLAGDRGACGAQGGLHVEVTRHGERVTCEACTATPEWADWRITSRVGTLTDDDITWARSMLPGNKP